MWTRCALAVKIAGEHVSYSEMHTYTDTHTPGSPEASSRTERVMELEKGKENARRGISWEA